MANLVIGDKILSSVYSRTPGHAGDKATDRQDEAPGNDPALQQDSVELTNGGPKKLERPPSENLQNSSQAQDALRQLKAQLQERPADAAASHANLSQSQAFALLRS